MSLTEGEGTIARKARRTFDEIRNEIYELENMYDGISNDIELMVAKNRTAQAQREKVQAKIDGLKWAIGEDKK